MWVSIRLPPGTSCVPRASCGSVCGCGPLFNDMSCMKITECASVVCIEAYISHARPQVQSIEPHPLMYLCLWCLTSLSNSLVNLTACFQWSKQYEMHCNGSMRRHLHIMSTIPSRAGTLLVGCCRVVFYKFPECLSVK